MSTSIPPPALFMVLNRPTLKNLYKSLDLINNSSPNRKVIGPQSELQLFIKARFAEYPSLDRYFKNMREYVLNLD